MGKVLSIFKRRHYHDQHNEDDYQHNESGSQHNNVANVEAIFSEIPIHKTDFDEATTKGFGVGDGTLAGATCLCLAEPDFCVTGQRDGTVLLQDCENMTQRRKWHQHTRDVIKVVSYDDTVVSASRDSTIVVWKLGHDQPVCKLTEHKLAVTAIDFDKEGGDALVSGSRDNTLKWWDLETQECLGTVEESRNLITDVAWSCVSDIVIQTSEDKTVKLWDARSYELVDVLPAERQISTCCDVADNLCVSGYNGFVGQGCHLIMWDIRSPRRKLHQFSGHSETVTSCTFLSTNQFASTSNDGCVRVWSYNTNAADSTCLMTTNLSAGPLTSVKYHNNMLYVTSLSQGLHKIPYHLNDL